MPRETDAILRDLISKYDKNGLQLKNANEEMRMELLLPRTPYYWVKFTEFCLYAAVKYDDFEIAQELIKDHLESQNTDFELNIASYRMAQLLLESDAFTYKLPDEKGETVLTKALENARKYKQVGGVELFEKYYRKQQNIINSYREVIKTVQEICKDIPKIKNLVKQELFEEKRIGGIFLYKLNSEKIIFKLGIDKKDNNLSLLEKLKDIVEKKLKTCITGSITLIKEKDSLHRLSISVSSNSSWEYNDTFMQTDDIKNNSDIAPVVMSYSYSNASKELKKILDR